jgi:hypothetical protein
MGRKLSAHEIEAGTGQTPAPHEIALYAMCSGASGRDSLSLRRALALPVSTRVWHRVFPYLPRELRADGALIVWHPDEAGWNDALERVHARAPLKWRKSGASLLMPGTDRAVLLDFGAFDELDLIDWSIAVPDARFRAMCARLQTEPCRLSELVARWALEVGPVRAGAALAMRADTAPGTRH